MQIRIPIIRFIPAGAGNTPSRKTECGTDTVYPRWRGEHWFMTYKLIYPVGLSPLARGTRNVATTGDRFQRFIPAGAGNTGVTCTPVPAGTVYPRWRGEHISGTISPIYKTGLSPLARGTPLLQRRFPAPWRFIPASAGNTSYRSRQTRIYTVYPR